MIRHSEPFAAAPDSRSRRLMRGAAWLVRATKDGTHFPASPIGFYVAKLWYYERLYPILLVSEAFERMTSASRVT